MARFNFRHGLARYQEDGVGNPGFLQPSNGGSYVDLLVAPDPVVFIAAHYDADYMLTENASKAKAWGPFVTGTNYYLYWDTDFITGELTRGYSTLEPVHGDDKPNSPAVDQHWFDTDDTVMKVWSGSSWVEKIRVFAATYANGAVLTQRQKGSQVSISDTKTFAGPPLFDPDGNPLQKFQRNRRGQFITTETDLHSQFSRIANFRVEAAVVQAEANEEIPIHYCVAYFDYDRLVLGRNTDTTKPVIGVSMEEMNTNEVRSFITKGYISNEIDWDWSASTVGTPIYCGTTGSLDVVPPISGMSQQVATVINKTTIFVDIRKPILVGIPAPSGSTALLFDPSTGAFVSSGSLPSGGSTILGGLLDVNLTTPIDGQTLSYDSINDVWINSSVGSNANTNPLGWIPDNTNADLRIADTYTDNGTTYGIRSAYFNADNKLEMELARFDPLVSVTDQQLKWDETATSFSVSIDNPTDFPSRYIASVLDITDIVGVHPTLLNYNIDPPLPTPNSGVDWTQTIQTTLLATILSNGSALSGGIAAATIRFADDQTTPWPTTDDLNITWEDANTSILFSSLSGNTFLGTYASVYYTVSNTGISNQGNVSNVVTAIGGTLDNIAGSGTMTFNDLLHIGNNFSRSVSVSTTFARPSGVTGTGYTVLDSAADPTITASFTYPTFYVWSVNTITPPSRADVITGNAFSGSVVLLGNQQVQLDTLITNPAIVPQGFWLAIDSSVTQPTVFQTGPSVTLLSDVAVVTGNTVLLSPDVPEVGYPPVEYTLYGITLQPGSTYVRVT